MKLNSSQLDRTLSQFHAEVLPDNHPAVRQLNTYLEIIRSFSVPVASTSGSRPKCRKKKFKLMRKFKLVRLSTLPAGAMRA
jgi:hypothetical protein